MIIEKIFERVSDFVECECNFINVVSYELCILVMVIMGVFEIFE